MSQYTLSYIHSVKCKKEAKLDAQMSKELQKAAQAKPKEIICKVTTEKVLFKNMKEVIIRQNIAKTRKNKEKKIIVLAAKTEKKNQMLIYALKFTDEDNFNRFSEEISNGSKDLIAEKQLPTAPSGSRTSTSTKRPHSTASKREELHQYDNINSLQRTSNGIFPSESRVPTPVSTESTIKTIQSSRRSLTHTPSRVIEMKPKLRSATPTSSSSSSSSTPRQQRPLSQKKPLRTPVRTESLPSVSTYITTDVLNSPKRAGGPQRDSVKMPLSEVYPTRDGPQKHRSRAEVNYLNYVPGKGMVNSGEENIYQYSSRIRNASVSLSSSPVSSYSRSSSRGSNTSSSTSSTDLYAHSTVYRLVPVNVSKASGINRSKSSGRSGMRRASVTSSSSSTTRNQPKPKINVWQYRDLSVNSTSSTSTDTSRDALQRPEARSCKQKYQDGVDYQECPTCHSKTLSRTRAK